METSTFGIWLGLVLGGLPLLGWLLWWWNELWFAAPLKLRCRATATKLPPGHMGFPFIGAMLTFLWYFKFRRCPDEFINSKRRKYGDGEGLYKTYLFGSPSVIACFLSVNKFVLQSDDSFILEWPNINLVGPNSLVAVQGKAHAMLRSYVTNAINRPKSLRHIAATVQPRMVAALQSWARKGTVNAYRETRRLTLENIGKLFASIEAGPVLDSIDELYDGLVKGLRAQPFNLPGTASYHATRCRKKLVAIFRAELEKRKREKKNGVKNSNNNRSNDLMDGLMEMKDEELGGNKLGDQVVLDNIVSLVIAGYESTTLASMWAIYCLAKYPNVLQKLREENMGLRKEKQGEDDDFITSEDVSKLKYTNKVVEETIRMANIASFVFRRVIKEDKPARPAAYQVFGGGPRICAGNMLARLQLALLLHHLSIRYRWELLNPNAEMIYLPHQRPIDGVEVSFNTLSTAPK